MRARSFVVWAVGSLSLGSGLATGGCMLLVNDGNYSVGDGGTSSGSSSSGSSSSGSTSGTSTTGSAASGAASTGATSGVAAAGTFTGTASTGMATTGTASTGMATAGSSTGASTAGSSTGASSGAMPGCPPALAQPGLGCGSPPGSDCISCEQTTCATEWDDCEANPACVSFRQCEATCASQQCNCNAMYPSGASLWLALNTCATSNCLPCPFMSVGDPCLSDVDCDVAMCAGLWCSPFCKTATDCVGANFNGANLLGQTNYCIENTNNDDICFPGCMSNADCIAFQGTDCEMGTPVDSPCSVGVCTLPADAGTN